jgi:hypothetical protein
VKKLLERMVAQLELRERVEGWLRPKSGGLGLEEWAAIRRLLPDALEQFVASPMLCEDELPSYRDVCTMIGQAEACAGGAAMPTLLPIDVRRATAKRKRNEQLDGMLEEAWPGDDEHARCLRRKISAFDPDLSSYASCETGSTAVSRSVRKVIRSVAALHRRLNAGYPDVLPLLTEGIFMLTTPQELWDEESTSKLAALARWTTLLFNRVGLGSREVDLLQAPPATVSQGHSDGPGDTTQGRQMLQASHEWLSAHGSPIEIQPD